MTEQVTQSVTQPIAHHATQLERTKLHIQTQISDFEREVFDYERKIDAIQGQIAALQTALDSLDNLAPKRKPGRPRTRLPVVRDKHKMSEEGRLNITVTQKERHLKDNLGKLKGITDPTKRKRLEKRIAKQRKEYDIAVAKQKEFEAGAEQAGEEAPKHLQNTRRQQTPQVEQQSEGRMFRSEE